MSAALIVALVVAALGAAAGAFLPTFAGYRPESRWTVAAITGILFALAVVTVTAIPALPPASGIVMTIAYLMFALVSVLLALIDLDTHRLPNVIVYPAGLIGAALLTLTCVFGFEWAALLRAAIGMLALAAFYLVLRIASRAGMGGGDVKLAAVIGLHLGFIGWGSLAVGAIAAFLLGGLAAVFLIVTRRGGRRTAIPFGPWMLIGAWVGIPLGDRIAGVLFPGL